MVAINDRARLVVTFKCNVMGQVRRQVVGVDVPVAVPVVIEDDGVTIYVCTHLLALIRHLDGLASRYVIYVDMMRVALVRVIDDLSPGDPGMIITAAVLCYGNYFEGFALYVI